MTKSQVEQTDSNISFPKGFSLEKARKTQMVVSAKVITEDAFPKSKYITGIDVAYRINRAFASAVVMEYDGLKVVESESVVADTHFPYVPTLLSFREAPAILKLLAKIKVKPFVYLIDGHGLAHPYKCGLASYVGVLAVVPTIGVAKNLLCGSVGEFNMQNYASIINKGEIIGAALRTKTGANQIFISIGNMVSLGTAINIVKHCLTNSRIPEPIREAHGRANELRNHKLEVTD